MIARPRRAKTPDHTGRTAYVNARIIDPATGLDAKGGLLIDGEIIADVGAGLFANGVPSGVETIDCGGACLARTHDRAFAPVIQDSVLLLVGGVMPFLDDDEPEGRERGEHGAARADDDVDVAAADAVPLIVPFPLR